MESTSASSSSKSGGVSQADIEEMILGTWEGHSTSGDSVMDDGKDHRWEYKADGSFVLERSRKDHRKHAGTH